jgi:hypothetical protein
MSRGACSSCHGGCICITLGFAELRAAVFCVVAWHQPPPNTSPASVVGNETCRRPIRPRVELQATAEDRRICFIHSLTLFLESSTFPPCCTYGSSSARGFVDVLARRKLSGRPTALRSAPKDGIGTMGWLNKAQAWRLWCHDIY